MYELLKKLHSIEEDWGMGLLTEEEAKHQILDASLKSIGLTRIEVTKTPDYSLS